jgi:hypothetical protein
MSTEDNPEKSREESPEWHRARAERLRKNGFTKMAEEQLAQAMRASNRSRMQGRQLRPVNKKSPPKRS